MAFRPPATTRRHAVTLQPLQAHDRDRGDGGSHEASHPSLGSPGNNVPQTPSSDEWVVFSPSSATTTTARTTRTNALSRGASDVGSGGEVVLSPRASVARRHAGIPPESLGDFEEVEEEGVIGYDDETEEEEEEESGYDTETDSLLPFREQNAPVMLPTHDGLGTFPPSSSSAGVVSGLLEESLRMVAMAGRAAGGGGQADINARIQKWQEEQWKAILEEVQKASRKEVSPLAGVGGCGTMMRGGDLLREDEASLLNASDEADVEKKQSPASSPSTSTSTRSNSGEDEERQHQQEETFWQRITRRFIRDIMGIDDEILFIIFGESLPPESDADSFLAEGRRLGTPEGERLLSRIAKELGVMINQYTMHPADDGCAFSTVGGKIKGEEEEEEEEEDHYHYANTADPPSRSLTSPREQKSSTAAAAAETSSPSSTTMPHYKFTPTLPFPLLQHDDSTFTSSSEDELADAQTRREYWEQDIGVRVLFSFFKARFSSSPSSSSSSPSPTPPRVTPHPPPPPPPHALSPSQNNAKTSLGVIHPLVGRARAKKAGSTSGRSISRGFYWDGNKCATTGVWAAI